MKNSLKLNGTRAIHSKSQSLHRSQLGSVGRFNVSFRKWLCAFCSVFALSVQAQTYIDGTTGPCGNQNYVYSVINTPSCTTGSCTATTDQSVHANFVSYNWNADEGVIVSGNGTPSATIKWTCPRPFAQTVKCTTQCHTFTLNAATGDCDETISETVTTLSGIQVKCPSTTGISGVAYIPCCTTSQYTFSTSGSGLDHNFEWHFPSGWTIISGQGTSTVVVVPGNGISSQDVISVDKWVAGCDKTLNHITVTKSISRIEDVNMQGTWPTSMCQGGTTMLCVDPFPCATTTYSWTATPGAFSGTNFPNTAIITPNNNCATFVLTDNNINNLGFYDINLSVSSPCGTKTFTRRIKVPHSVPVTPAIDWDGEDGYLCVGRRNVLLWTTNDDPTVDDWEWTFDNGTTTYTQNGQMIGTRFEEFGPSWMLNPNSNVTVTVRTHNDCGWSASYSFTISAARFKAYNDNENCGNYPASPATLSIESADNQTVSSLVLVPNPSSENVTLKWSTAKSQVAGVTVFDLSGKVVLTLSQIGNGEKIDISNLPEGTYFVKVSTKEELFVSRFVVKR